MALRDIITNDLTTIYTAANGGTEVTYRDATGVATILCGAWSLGDMHAQVPDLEQRHIGQVIFRFPITQLSEVSRKGTIQHPDHPKPWTITKIENPSAFMFRLTLTQPRDKKAHLPQI